MVAPRGVCAWLLPGRCMVAPVGVCVVALGGVHGCSGGEACMVAPGGVGGCSGGVCVVAPVGHVWLLLEGCAWLLLGGMCGCSRGACMVAPGGCVWLLWGVCMVALVGHAWDMKRYGDTVNERAVCILLECILVFTCFMILKNNFLSFINRIITIFCIFNYKCI